MIDADLLIADADVVATCAGRGPQAGSAQGHASLSERTSVASCRGRIVWVGAARDAAAALALTPDATVIDGRGLTVTPGFVDPHTHLVFGGDRRDELQRRLAGATYAEIAAGGGGIVKTVAATRAATEDALVEAALPRLASMLAHGTTTAEVKSGYGLDLDTELRQLRAIQRLAHLQPVSLSSTFMGAHEIPPEYRGRAEVYVDHVIHDMIPAVAEARLAEWCDVFCERGVFTPDQSVRILEAGRAHGLMPRIHADELALSGGSAVAAQVGARSADHLIHVDAPHADRLRDAGVMATLLPAAAFFLKLGQFAPARMLIEHGVPVALATDFNPGGGFTPSMPFVMSLACFAMHMTMEEALVASTINAAAALAVDDRCGSLEVGKVMDAVLIRGPLTEVLKVGATPIAGVIKDGLRVC
jgi:imidazolonepropionase